MVNVFTANPEKLSTQDNISAWVVNGLPKNRIELGKRGMDEKSRARALKDIGTRAVSRVKNGKREYLLHRSIGPSEATRVLRDGIFDSTKHKIKIGRNRFSSYGSWSPTVNNFNDRSHIVSAWIPEENISFYPHIYGSKFSDKDSIRGLMSAEKEIIVNPGKFEILHQTKADGKTFGDYRKPIPQHARAVITKLIPTLTPDQLKVVKNIAGGIK